MSDFSGSMGSLSLDGDRHQADFNVAEWMGYGAAHYEMEVHRNGQNQTLPVNTPARSVDNPPGPEVLRQRGRILGGALGLVFAGLLGVAGGYSLSSRRAIVGGVLLGLSGIGLGCSVALCCLSGQSRPSTGNSPV